MRVRVGETVRRGRALDLREISGLRETQLSGRSVAEVSVASVVEAVRHDSVGWDAERDSADCDAGRDSVERDAGRDSVERDAGRDSADWDAEPDHLLTVECPAPGPAHEFVGAIGTDVTVSRRPALAACARSRGHTAPQADELAAVRERLDALDPPAVDLQRARKRVADASDVESEWRERVATLQGRVQALREVGVDFGDAGPGDADLEGEELEDTNAEVANSESANSEDTNSEATDLGDAEAELAEATRRLSEIETERIAAEQALSRARETAREHRETRRKRLRLEDRAGNLRRAAREHLSARVVGAFEEARNSLPDANLSDGVADALALARAAEMDAPVVVSHEASPFETPEDESRWLDAPVLRV